jgi:hypothetical protein
MAIVTVDELSSKVLQKVQDDDIDSDFVLQSFNQCLVHIATVINVNSLATVTEVTFTAGGSIVPLPSDFHKNFVFGFNKTTNTDVIVVESRRILDRNIFGKKTYSGNVITACTDYPNIYYQYSPSSDQLIDVYYHKLPTELVDGGNFPSYIPWSHLHKLFFNFAASAAYDIIEDGIDGGPDSKKTNTMYHDIKFKEALEEIKLFFGPDADIAYGQRGNPRFDFNE